MQRQPLDALDKFVNHSADFIFVDYTTDVDFNIILANERLG